MVVTHHITGAKGLPRGVNFSCLGSAPLLTPSADEEIKSHRDDITHPR